MGDYLDGYSDRFRELLMTSKVPWQVMALEVSSSPELCREALKFHAVVIRSREPAQPEELILALDSHKDDFPSVAMPDEVWHGLWKSYAKTLANFSLEALSEAFRAWTAGEMYPKDLGRHTVYPTPQELATLCQRYVSSLNLIGYRAKLAFEAAQTTEPAHDELAARAELGEAL